MNNLMIIEGDEEILDTYVIEEKPQGLGVSIDTDASYYEDFIIKIDSSFICIEDYVIVYLFDNELPYRVGDAQVNFVNTKTNTLIETQDVVPIIFEEYPTFMVEEKEGVISCVKQLLTKAA